MATFSIGPDPATPQAVWKTSEQLTFQCTRNTGHGVYLCDTTRHSLGVALQSGSVGLCRSCEHICCSLGSISRCSSFGAQAQRFRTGFGMAWPRYIRSPKASRSLSGRLLGEPGVGTFARAIHEVSLTLNSVPEGLHTRCPGGREWGMGVGRNKEVGTAVRVVCFFSPRGLTTTAGMTTQRRRLRLLRGLRRVCRLRRLWRLRHRL